MSDELFTIRSVSLLSSSAHQLLTEWEACLALGVLRDLSDEEWRILLLQRDDLARLIQATARDLDYINPALFPYLSVTQKKHLRQQLVRAHYLHAMAAHIDKLELKLDKFYADCVSCRRYERLLDNLKHIPAVGEETHPENELQRCSDESDKPFGWTGMCLLAPVLANNMHELAAGELTLQRFLFGPEGKLGGGREVLRGLNKKPVYLGWSRQFILCVVNRVSNVMQHRPRENQALAYLGEGLGSLNFVAVQTLFALELFLVMKNSLTGIWMQQKRALGIPAYEIFQRQIASRRFLLVDLLCSSLTGIIGLLSTLNTLNVWPWTVLASAAYRLIDIVIAWCKYAATQQEHENSLYSLQQEIDLLQQRETNTSDVYEREQLLAQRCQLQRAYVQQSNQWRFSNLESRNRLISALGFMIGFGLFSAFFMPPALIPTAIMVIMTLTGAAMCVAMSLLMISLKADVELQRTKCAEELTKQQLEGCLLKFNEYKALEPTEETLAFMKALYLEMKQLAAQEHYRQELYNYQLAFMTVSLISDSLFPPAVILALLFLPTGVSLAAILVVVLVHCTVWFVARSFEPKEKGKYPVFDDKEFTAFCAEPEIARLVVNNQKQRIGLFKSIQKLDDNEETNSADYLGPDDSPL